MFRSIPRILPKSVAFCQTPRSSLISIFIFIYFQHIISRAIHLVSHFSHTLPSVLSCIPRRYHATYPRPAGDFANVRVKMTRRRETTLHCRARGTVVKRLATAPLAIQASCTRPTPLSPPLSACDNIFLLTRLRNQFLAISALLNVHLLSLPSPNLHRVHRLRDSKHLRTYLKHQGPQTWYQLSYL